MTVRVVGSGLGRTGTASLKLALERLLGEPCYHMIEVFSHPDHVELWRRAAVGEPTDWDALLAGYAAVVDWPAAPFWEELAAAFPDAVILHSTRTDTEAWYRSASSTIFHRSNHDDRDPEFDAMWTAIADLTFDGSFLDAEVAKAGYERHNAHVMATAPSDRLVQYQPGDGWEPLCAALGVAVPDEPFPHVNTTAEFRERAGFDAET